MVEEREEKEKSDQLDAHESWTISREIWEGLTRRALL